MRRLDEWLLIAALCVALAAVTAALVASGWGGRGPGDRAGEASGPPGGGWAARVAWSRP